MLFRSPADNSKIKAVNTSSSVADILRGSFLVELETFDRFGTGDVGFTNNSGMQFNVKSPDKDEFAPNSWYEPTKNKNLYDYIRTFFNVEAILHRRKETYITQEAKIIKLSTPSHSSGRENN